MLIKGLYYLLLLLPLLLLLLLLLLLQLLLLLLLLFVRVLGLTVSVIWNKPLTSGVFIVLTLISLRIVS